VNLSIHRREALGLLAAAPLLANAPEPAGPWTRRGDIAVGGGRLHFAEMGQGAPLVVLHKLGGWIADWRFAAPYLAAGRRVIAFDLPGHGDSRMYGPAPYIMTVPESAAMLLAALDELGVDRCDFAGNSLGGITAAVIAACWPARVRRLAIVSASLIGAMSREQLTQQDADRARLVAAAKAAGRPYESPQKSSFMTMDPRVTEEHDAGSARAGAWLRPSERGVGRVGVVDYLPRITAPTLLINADRGNYVKYGEVGGRLIPNSRRVSIRDAGSFVHQEKPAETAAAINAFLDAA
jgi:pimeloyl-ACP methyl ester carboxylesterase